MSQYRAHSELRNMMIRIKCPFVDVYSDAPPSINYRSSGPPENNPMRILWLYCITSHKSVYVCLFREYSL